MWNTSSHKIHNSKIKASGEEIATLRIWVDKAALISGMILHWSSKRAKTISSVFLISFLWKTCTSQVLNAVFFFAMNSPRTWSLFWGPDGRAVLWSTGMRKCNAPQTKPQTPGDSWWSSECNYGNRLCGSGPPMCRGCCFSGRTLAQWCQSTASLRSGAKSGWLGQRNLGTGGAPQRTDNICGLWNPGRPPLDEDRTVRCAWRPLHLAIRTRVKSQFCLEGIESARIFIIFCLVWSSLSFSLLFGGVALKLLSHLLPYFTASLVLQCWICYW